MIGIQIAPGCTIPARYLSRHIGIFGATGTGKTTTAAAIVERAPCPVLVIDAKGDLESLGLLYRPWAAQLHISRMGADLLTRALDLSEAQSGALVIALAWAEDEGWSVTSLSDLRGLLTDVIEAAPMLSGRYGLVSPQSVAAVQRSILRLERAVPWAFGSRVVDWRDVTGVAVLGASALTHVAGLYGATVAHILDSLYRGLGELGDVPVPGLLVLIDEAHLVFDGATPAVVRRIEQVTRLIRSKGVGLIYVTQSPTDLPDAITGQLATRIQHGLRAATPRQLKGLRAAAESMPGRCTMQDVQRLGTGQALVSVPDGQGVPQPGRMVQVQRGKVALVAMPHESPPRIFPDAPPQFSPPPRELKPEGRPWWFWPLIAALLIYVPALLFG